jgi:hypothetical protein
VAADPCPAGTTKQMLNGDGVSNPGEDPNLLLSDYCVPCGPGVFCDPSAATALATSAQPQNCPAGTYGGVIGAKSVAGCIDCPIGTYQDMDGQFECLACAANTFASAPGSTSCQSCGDGFEVSTSGSNMCNPCKPGFYRDSAVSEKCLECPAGTSSGEGGWSGCVLFGGALVLSVLGRVSSSAFKRTGTCRTAGFCPVADLLLPVLSAACAHIYTQVLPSATSACPAALLRLSSPPPVPSAPAERSRTSMVPRSVPPARREHTRTPARQPSARSALPAPLTRRRGLSRPRHASE